MNSAMALNHLMFSAKIEVSQKQGEEHGVNLVCAQQGEQHQK
jgi:hypothetical protein